MTLHVGALRVILDQWLKVFVYVLEMRHVLRGKGEESSIVDIPFVGEEKSDGCRFVAFICAGEPT